MKSSFKSMTPHCRDLTSRMAESDSTWPEHFLHCDARVVVRDSIDFGAKLQYIEAVQIRIIDDLTFCFRNVDMCRSGRIHTVAPAALRVYGQRLCLPPSLEGFKRMRVAVRRASRAAEKVAKVTRCREGRVGSRH